MSPIRVTDYLTEGMLADNIATVPLLEDDFSLQANGLVNRAGYVMTTPAAGGPIPANDSYPFNIATVLVPYDSLYGGSNQFNPWPCTGWFQSVGQFQVLSGVMVAGGGPSGGTNNNDVSVWAHVGVVNLRYDLWIQFAAADAAFADMSGTGNTIGVIWMNARSQPSNQRGIAWGNNRVAAVFDGTHASAWAFNAAAAGGLQNVVACPLVDTHVYKLSLILQGQTYTLLKDDALVVTGTLPTGGTLQAGTDQRPFPFSLDMGVELYRPNAAGDGGNGPAPTTKVLRVKVTSTDSVSYVASGLISSQGDYLSNGNGDYLTAR